LLPLPGMKRTALLICLSTAALPVRAAPQQPPPADPWLSAGTWMLTVEVGGAAFSDFQRTQARPVDGNVAIGDFERRVSARTAGSIGGWASYWIGRTWGVRAGMSYVPSSFTVWNEEGARRSLDTADPDYDPSYASLGIWLANVSLVFRFPHTFGRVTPYGLVGGGVVRYNVSEDAAIPPEALAHVGDGVWQTGAGMFGIGAAIPLQRSNLLMSFELTNHVSRSPLAGKSGDEVFEMGGVPMQVHATGAGGENEVSLTSHVRLALGLTLPLR
jgi:hypothetical protein